MKKANDIKKLLPLACALSLALASPAQAQEGGIDGYYRIQNGLGYAAGAAGSKYVVQSDMLHAAPNLSADDARTNAGTVFYIKASPVKTDANGNSTVYGLPAGALRIDKLRSQGVELIGDSTDSEGNPFLRKEFYSYWQAPYRDLVAENVDLYNGTYGTGFSGWLKAYAAAWRQLPKLGYVRAARCLIEAFIYNTAYGLTDTDGLKVDGTEVKGNAEKTANILGITRRFNEELADALDIDAYLLPVTLADGTTQGYRIMWRPIDWVKVTDFFKKPENMKLFQDGLKAMSQYMSFAPGTSLEYNEIPLLLKLGYDLYDDLRDPMGLTTGDYPAGWTRGRALGKPSDGAGLRWDEGGACETLYETIFTHPKLLFGWVKMALYKMMRSPGSYKTPILHFGGWLLYQVFTMMGQDELFMSYLARYPYYDSRCYENRDQYGGYYTPDWDIYLIDGFLSQNGEATSNANGTSTTDELRPGDTYKPLGRFGFYLRKHQKDNSGNEREMDYYDYSLYKSYVDPLSNAYLPRQWWPAHPTDYATNGGTTAAEHSDYWESWWKLTVMQTKQKGVADSEPVSPTSYVGGGQIDNISDGAKWVLKPVDASQPFYVVPNAKAQGLTDGHYYTSLYVDFPIDVAACSEGMRFYTVGSEVMTGTDAAGAAYSYVEVTEVKDVVPARQPVVVETTGTEADACMVVPAARDGATPRTPSLLQGVFFNAGKNKATPGIATTNTIDLSAKAEYLVGDAFRYHYDTPGTMTYLSDELNNRYAIAFSKTDDQLYTLQRHQTSADDRNPMGFYPYSGATLAGNKVFLIQSKAASGAKISLGGPDVTDGIGEVKGEEGKEVKNQSDIYDLQGRRVTSPVAGGVYVVGGRKVLITK